MRIPPWTNIVPELHAKIIADVESQLLRRSLPGSAIYLFIIAITALTTSLLRELPLLTWGALGALTLVTALRMIITLRYLELAGARTLALITVYLSLGLYLIVLLLTYRKVGLAPPSISLIFGLAGITSVAPPSFSPARRFAAIYLSLGYLPLLLILGLLPVPGSSAIFLIAAFGYPTTLAVVFRIHRDFWTAKETAVIAEERATALQEAKSAAEHANRAKTTFLARMTHELRTPMNGVLGIARLLADAKLPPPAHEHVELILRAGNSLLHIINEVLDFSRLEAGKLTLHLQPFDPAALLRDHLAIFRVRAETAGIDLRLDGLESLPPALLGDGERVRQILTNLVGNALKFTNEGHIQILVAATVEEAVCTVHLRVEDTGIGIDASHLDDIFAPFEQASAHVTPRFGGTGLGLAIVRDLVEQMSGTIEVHSRPGEGTRFDLSLPFPIADAPRPLPATTPDDPVNDTPLPSLDTPTPPHRMPSDAPDAALPSPADLPANPPRVLVAEDDRISQRVARGFLERLGCQVDIADNGQRAVTLCASRHYDLILMDCNMPVLDGYEAAKEIRALHHPPPPIVALTANAQPEDRREARDCGIIDHLSKPIDHQALEIILDRWIPSRSSLSRSAG